MLQFDNERLSILRNTLEVKDIREGKTGRLKAPSGFVDLRVPVVYSQALTAKETLGEDTEKTGYDVEKLDCNAE